MKNNLKFDGVYQTSQPDGVDNLRFFENGTVIYTATIEILNIQDVFNSMQPINIGRQGFMCGEYNFDENNEIVFTVSDKGTITKLDFIGIVNEDSILFDVYSHINEMIYWSTFYFNQLPYTNQTRIDYLRREIMKNAHQAYRDEHLNELNEMRKIKEVASKYGLHLTHEETYPILYYYTSKEVWGENLPDLEINSPSDISSEQLDEWGLMSIRNKYTYKHFVDFVDNWHHQI